MFLIKNGLAVRYTEGSSKKLNYELKVKQDEEDKEVDEKIAERKKKAQEVHWALKSMLSDTQ